MTFAITRTFKNSKVKPKLIKSGYTFYALILVGSVQKLLVPVKYNNEYEPVRCTDDGHRLLDNLTIFFIIMYVCIQYLSRYTTVQSVHHTRNVLATYAIVQTAGGFNFFFFLIYSAKCPTTTGYKITARRISRSNSIITCNDVVQVRRDRVAGDDRAHVDYVVAELYYKYTIIIL